MLRSKHLVGLILAATLMATLIPFSTMVYAQSSEEERASPPEHVIEAEGTVRQPDDGDAQYLGRFDVTTYDGSSAEGNLRSVVGVIILFIIVFLVICP